LGTTALVEPQEAESVSLNVYIWIDDYRHMSYIDVHVFGLTNRLKFRRFVISKLNVTLQRTKLFSFRLKKQI